MSRYGVIRSFAVWYMCMTLAFALPAVAYAQEGSADAQAEAAGPEKEAKQDTSGYKIEKPTYAYQSQLNRDPFRSLIQEITEDVEDRPPLQSYDVSQMKLLGIVMDKKGDYALVVLPDGKSYTVTEGMGIGLHRGKVKDISSDHVLVQEPKRDYKGVERLEESFLRLRKEGDE
jgi:Tfp pilus assembly protein PilP